MIPVKHLAYTCEVGYKQMKKPPLYLKLVASFYIKQEPFANWQRLFLLHAYSVYT